MKNRVHERLGSDEICIGMHNAYLSCNEELFGNNKIDISLSGSTCVSVLTLGQKLFCANVGNSRAILVKMIDNEVIDS